MGESAQPVLVATIMPSQSAKESNCGMAQLVLPKRMSREGSLLQMASLSASIGRSQRAAPRQATPSDTGALGAERPVMGPKLALEWRRCETLSPYNPKAWAAELLCHGLLHRYPSLVKGFTDGFDLGIPKIHHTYTPPNHHSIKTLPDIYNDIVCNEFEAG